MSTLGEAPARASAGAAPRTYEVRTYGCQMNLNFVVNRATTYGFSGFSFEI
jgi:hypothetical protein